MANYTEQELKRAFNKAKIDIMNVHSSVFICTILFSLKHTWTTDISTAGVDGINLYINPDFFMSLNIKEQMGLLAHESWHVAFDHISRAMTYNHNLYNIAADYVINNMLVANKYNLPTGALIDKKYNNMTTEAVYKLLEKDIKIQNIITAGNYDYDIKDISKLPHEKQQALKDAAKDVLIKANIQAKAENEGIGNLPQEVQRELTKLTTPQLDWFTILMNYMEGFDKTDYSFAKPNRRFIPEYYLPSLYSNSMENLALAFDVSSSVTDKEFTNYVNETKYMRELVNPKSTTIISFTTKIINEYTLNSDDSMEDLKFKGYGGTDLRPVFEYFKHISPTVLIVFSDLECKKIKNDPGYPVIWIVVNSPKASVNFGTLIHLQTKN